MDHDNPPDELSIAFGHQPILETSVLTAITSDNSINVKPAAPPRAESNPRFGIIFSSLLTIAEFGPEPDQNKLLDL